MSGVRYGSIAGVFGVEFFVDDVLESSCEGRDARLCVSTASWADRVPSHEVIDDEGTPKKSHTIAVCLGKRQWFWIIDKGRGHRSYNNVSMGVSGPRRQGHQTR